MWLAASNRSTLVPSRSSCQPGPKQWGPKQCGRLSVIETCMRSLAERPRAKPDEALVTVPCAQAPLKSIHDEEVAAQERMVESSLLRTQCMRIAHEWRGVPSLCQQTSALNMSLCNPILQQRLRFRYRSKAVISRGFYRVLNAADGFIGSAAESLTVPYCSYAIYD